MYSNNFLPLLLANLILLTGCVSTGHNTTMKKKTSEEKMYQIFTAAGEEITMKNLIIKTAKADVILIGESHDNKAAHNFEIRFLRTLFEQLENKRELILSLEFFEKDIQTVLDEYLDGIITETHFLKSSKPWPGYRKSYRPLIEFSKKNNIPVVAANAPRRYVNLVSRKGASELEKLSPLAKSWIAPLPYQKASKEYLSKLDSMHRIFSDIKKTEPYHKKHNTSPATENRTAMNQEGKREKKVKIKNHSFFSEKTADAQSLWDATMAWSIVQNLKKKPESVVVNVNGKFHSDDKLGIPEHLETYHSGLKLITISIVRENTDTSGRFVKRPVADYIIISNGSTKPDNR